MEYVIAAERQAKEAAEKRAAALEAELAQLKALLRQNQ